MKLRFATVVTLVAAGLIAAWTGAFGGAAALARQSLTVEHAAFGEVAAVLSYRHDPSDVVTPYSALRLSITRDGMRLYDAPVSGPICGTDCWPAGPNALHVIDLGGSGEPDVLVDLYSGGEHCCYVDDIHVYRPTTHSYLTIGHIWGDPGYTLERLGGPRKQPELVSADDRFAYSFAAYAFSALPVQIWRLTGVRLLDVTRDYPAQIRPDAKRWWRSYYAARKTDFGLGFLAAWAADEYNLGAGARVDATLAQLRAAHELRSTPGFGPGGAGFTAHLDRFLRQTGYIQ